MRPAGYFLSRSAERGPTDVRNQGDPQVSGSAAERRRVHNPAAFFIFLKTCKAWGRIKGDSGSEKEKKVMEKMPPEEKAIELMTSAQRLHGGRAEALSLLAELRRKWGREIANIQRNAHDDARPYFHAGQPCRPEYNCHVGKVIDLAEGEPLEVSK